MLKTAVIVSNKLQHCHDHCRFKHLNKNDFYFAADMQHLLGLPRDLPVIITYCSGPLDTYMTELRRPNLDRLFSRITPHARQQHGFSVDSTVM